MMPQKNIFATHMGLKKIFVKIHLWLGLASGIVLMVVALTGSILVFEKEIDELVNHDFYSVKVPENVERKPLDHLMQQVHLFDTSIRISNIRLLTAAPSHTVIFTCKKRNETVNVAVNPYSGQVIRAIYYDRRFFSVVLKIHRQLLAGKTGKTITGISCICFVTLILTGLVLWWPTKYKALKQRVKIKWNGSSRRFNWGLHAVAGFYVHLFLLCIGITGLVFGFQWVNKTIFMIFDGKPMSKLEIPANRILQPMPDGYFEKLYQQTNSRLNYNGQINISIPTKDSLSITVTKENLESHRANIVDFLYFEKGTGHLLHERLYKNESRGMKARKLVFPIHTGQLYGWPTKLIAFVSCLVAFSLPITGFRIWLRRNKNNKRRKKDQKTMQHRKPALVQANI